MILNNKEIKILLLLGIIVSIPIYLYVINPNINLEVKEGEKSYNIEITNPETTIKRTIDTKRLKGLNSKVLGVEDGKKEKEENEEEESPQKYYKEKIEKKLSNLRKRTEQLESLFNDDALDARDFYAQKLIEFYGRDDLEDRLDVYDEMEFGEHTIINNKGIVAMNVTKDDNHLKYRVTFVREFRGWRVMKTELLSTD